MNALLIFLAAVVMASSQPYGYYAYYPYYAYPYGYLPPSGYGYGYGYYGYYKNKGATAGNEPMPIDSGGPRMNPTAFNDMPRFNPKSA
ncbi:unnamed protein product [Soboliphyme baturini]|uniref:Sulfur globule protein CV3 n=1 Tax=Soboliphyme baturini TaxID=241478 RepID=A0A183IF04_9BILA|nr:unnamed protein product [Soboliphyme baturini]